MKSLGPDVDRLVDVLRAHAILQRILPPDRGSVDVVRPELPE